MLNRLTQLLIGTVLILALACSGCAGRKQHGAPAPKAEPIARADSTSQPPTGVVVQPPRNLLDKLTGRTPPAVYYPPGTPVVVKGKKNTLTFNNVAGNQHNQTNTAGKNAVAGTGATGGKADGPVAGTGGTLTSIEKAKAPVSTGTGDATDLSGTGAASNIKGDNNAPVLTNAPVEASGWQAELARGFATPVGKVVALVVLAFVGYGVWRLWPVLRRKSSTNTTV